MLAKRIVACLDIRAGRVVKGRRFVELCDAGDPVERALRYRDDGADEIVVLERLGDERGSARVVADRRADLA